MKKTGGWCIVLLTLCLAFKAHAFDLWPFGDHGMKYDIRIEGIDPDNAAWFKKLNLTERTSDNPPKTLDELDSEGVRRDNQLLSALKARGYYDALVEYRLDRKAVPPVLVFHVTQGSRYRLAAVRVEWQGGKVRKLDTSAMPVKAGQFVDVEAINAYGAKLDAQIGKDSCLLSLNLIPVLELNGKNATATLLYRIKHGPKARFGKPLLHGNVKVHDSAILRNVTWKEGACYNDGDLAKTQSALIGTQLFSTVKVTPPTQVDSKGEAPIGIEMHERVERTITTGANYATDQGFGLKLGWEHRNYMGDAEKVDVNGVLAEQEQSLTLTERDPGFLRNDQTLVLSSSIVHEDTEAYSSHDIENSAAVERKISPQLDASAGLGLTLENTNDVLTGSQNFGLISVPLFVNYDTRDNAQDARKGIYTHVAVTPYVDTFDISTDFVKMQATGQTYLSSEIAGKPTLALRASVGGIEGATSASLPANLRFYAGGGGSVRGYSYQSLSPRFQGTPIGGGSLIELSAELRVRFNESFGGVVFLDGGNAYASSVPDFSNGLYYGAGAGVRYYSPLGPLRLDLGFPLNGNNLDGSGVDAKGFQVYVSIGQDF